MFKFQFKSVLDYRRRIVDVCHQKFSQSQRALDKQRSKLQECHELWQLNMENWRTRQKADASVMTINLYREYMSGLKKKIEHQASLVRSCIQISEEDRIKLLNARKEMNIIESLEQQHYERYKLQQSKKETAFFDDIAIQNFNNKGSKH